MEDRGERAGKAYDGEEHYFQFGQWLDVEQKILKFRGTREDSWFWVKTKEGCHREGASHHGIKELELLVNDGESVFAMNAFIQFKTTTK
jgi:hypothetical protein